LRIHRLPIINQPRVQRYQPLVDGTHCRYYDVEGDDLIRVVLDALQDRAQIARLAAEGRAHVLRLFTLARCARTSQNPVGSCNQPSLSLVPRTRSQHRM
jgi:hypothetical protein